jgi:predicted ABC-type transport system involved in lysophospholipase L1 biosynthesis ATPase subunit
MDHMDQNQTVLSCRNLAKTFAQGKYAVNVLSGIDLTVAKGERVAIVGASGSIPRQEAVSRCCNRT